MLHKLHEMDAQGRGCIEKFEFSKLAKLLHDFCNEDLSAFYFDIRKDRLYCDRVDLFERQACRTVMAEIYSHLTTWLAPIVSFTAEEAWSHRPEGVFEEEESIHLREFPTTPDEWKNAALADKWVSIQKTRKSVTESIEPMRASKELGSSLEAMPVITTEDQTVLDCKNLADICITSAVKLRFGPPSVTIEKAAGDKCERCWKVLPEVKENNWLCNRCTDAVDAQKKSEAA